MGTKITGCFLVIAILFSYLPILSRDDCTDGGRLGNMKMDCGYSFHCPMIADRDTLEASGLPLNGQLVSSEPLLVVKELTHSIFHPPKYV